MRRLKRSRYPCRSGGWLQSRSLDSQCTLHSRGSAFKNRLLSPCYARDFGTLGHRAVNPASLESETRQAGSLYEVISSQPDPSNGDVRKSGSPTRLHARGPSRPNGPPASAERRRRDQFGGCRNLEPPCSLDRSGRRHYSCPISACPCLVRTRDCWLRGAFGCSRGARILTARRLAARARSRRWPR